MPRYLDWAGLHATALMTAAGTILAAALVAVIWRTARRGSAARVLRNIAIPLVLAWEAQGLYGVALRVGVPRELAWVLAAVTSATILTFAAYAHEHYGRHGTLGPNGRMMWYTAVPMGLVVAANASSPAGVGLRIVLPLLSVAAFRAAYLPDEPAGHAAARGAWRVTPRRLGVALGLLDPAETDLRTVHAERRIRQLTLHAAGYHRGARLLRRWHGWRFERLALMADDRMIGEARRRVARVHTGLASTDPAPASPAAAASTPGSMPEAGPEARPAARPAPRPAQAPRPALRLTPGKSRSMSPGELEPHVSAMLEAYGTVSQARVKRDLHVSTDKAAEALRLARRARTVVQFAAKEG